jgi:hypothetical protein
MPRSPDVTVLARVAAATVVAVAMCGTSSAATVPSPVADAVHGRVLGWARSPTGWFVVYVDRRGGDWCGLRGGSWRIALVTESPPPAHVVSGRRIGGAMCGNALAWVRAGRFSDGRHREAAFLLWATPSLGATAFVYRIERRRLARLATFHGDRVSIKPGVVVIGFENRGRSPHGEIEDTYRFVRGAYRLVSSR